MRVSVLELHPLHWMWDKKLFTHTHTLLVLLRNSLSATGNSRHVFVDKHTKECLGCVEPGVFRAAAARQPHVSSCRAQPKHSESSADRAEPLYPHSTVPSTGGSVLPPHNNGPHGNAPLLTLF